MSGHAQDAPAPAQPCSSTLGVSERARTARLNQPNNIGLLRLMLASMVIIGHAPEMVDGNRMRDPIFATFGVLSLGTLAVDGFFFISGVLITRSMLSTASIQAFALRRVLRIYPAFIVASLIGFMLFGALLGTNPLQAGLKPLYYVAALRPIPELPGQLEGLHYPVINGALGTIIYEARCYILVALLWTAGILARRKLVVLLTAFFITLMIASTFPTTAAWLDRLSGIHGFDAVIGEPMKLFRFTGAFLVGSCFCLYKEEIDRTLTAVSAAACAAAALLALALGEHTGEAGIMIFGAAALYWLAYFAKLGRLQKINNDWDISYGVYLYGWPIATALCWSHRDISPWILAAVTLPAAMLAGAASWWGLERQALAQAKITLSRRSLNNAKTATLTNRPSWRRSG